MDDVLAPVGNLAFELTDKRIRIRFRSPDRRLLHAVDLPVRADSRRSVDELKCLVQDFTLFCYYRFVFRETANPSVRLKELAAILGVNFRTVSAEVVQIEHKILLKFAELCAVGNDMALKGKLTSSPGLKAMIEALKEAI